MLQNVRKKALVQYVTPYKVIDLREIAKAFNIGVEKIEEEIADLIISKSIQAKIDSHSKVRGRLTFSLVAVLEEGRRNAEQLQRNREDGRHIHQGDVAFGPEGKDDEGKEDAEEEPVDPDDGQGALVREDGLHLNNKLKTN